MSKANKVGSDISLSTKSKSTLHIESIQSVENVKTIQCLGNESDNANTSEGVDNMEIPDTAKKNVDESKGVKTPLCELIKQKKIPEKLTFFISNILVLLIVYSMARLQSILPYYFTVAIPSLTILRVYQYWKLKYQFFLLDFCYFANLAFMIFIWATPWQPQFFNVLFALANGPMLFSVFIFRNSLVFHDYDRLTSISIHILPPVLTFSIRWYPADTSTFWYTPFYANGTETSPIWLMAVPYGCYVIHKILYVCLVFVVIRPGPEYLTSFTYFTNKGRGFAYKVLNTGGKKYQLAIFILFDLICCAISIALSSLYYHFFEAHVMAMVLGFCVIIWNGSTYYMDRFSGLGFKEDGEQED